MSNKTNDIMNPDLNKANQEHKDLDNRSYIIGFEEGYNNALAYLEKTVEKLKDDQEYK